MDVNTHNGWEPQIACIYKLENMERDYQEKVSHLYDLIRLSRADGKESLSEISFINSVAVKLGIDVEDMEIIRSEFFHIKFLPPEHEADVIPQFYRLVFLMVADRQIDTHELNFCYDLGMRMGLNLYAVQEILKKMIAHKGERISVVEMNDIFRKYYN